MTRPGVKPPTTRIASAPATQHDHETRRLSYGSMTRSPQVDDDLAALVHRVANRDAEAFASFYDHTSARVFGLVNRVVRDRGYSEETTQEVYLQVWQNAANFKPAAGSAMAWLLTLAHRRAVDRVRAEQAATQRDSRYGSIAAERDADVVADSAIIRDERRRVAECLGSLTDTQRESIELAYYGGLTYAQVSERLSANLATVKSRMRDGLRALRNCLGMA
jgi:RNA polymerase sigma-70 factor, ECF subfamily